jgi:hypothetical protein
MTFPALIHTSRIVREFIPCEGGPEKGGPGKGV